MVDILTHLLRPTNLQSQIKYGDMSLKKMQCKFILLTPGSRRSYIKKNFVRRKSLVKAETLLLPTDAHNVKKHRVIKTF